MFTALTLRDDIQRHPKTAKVWKLWSAGWAAARLQPVCNQCSASLPAFRFFTGKSSTCYFETLIGRSDSHFSMFPISACVNTNDTPFFWYIHLPTVLMVTFRPKMQRLFQMDLGQFLSRWWCFDSYASSFQDVWMKIERNAPVLQGKMNNIGKMGKCVNWLNE